MTYELTTTNEGLPLIIVNTNIMFAWDPSDSENYGIFMQKLDEKGIDVFAQLLADDPNTGFDLFCV